MTLNQKGLVAAVLAAAIVAGVQTARLNAAQQDAVDAQLAPQRAAVATAQAKVETVTVRLAAAEKAVGKALGAVRVDTIMVAPQTAQDTATALVQLPGLAAAHDSLQRSCASYVVSCGEYRAAAEAREAARAKQVAGLEDALHDRPPRRNWQLGITAGYGATAVRDSGSRAWRAVTGPTLAAGLAWTPF